MRTANKFKVGDLVINIKLGILALIASIENGVVNVIYLDRDQTIDFNSTYDFNLFVRFWRIMG